MRATIRFIIAQRQQADWVVVVVVHCPPVPPPHVQTLHQLIAIERRKVEPGRGDEYNVVARRIGECHQVRVVRVIFLKIMV